jgi:hypothetical protein
LYSKQARGRKRKAKDDEEDPLEGGSSTSGEDGDDEIEDDMNQELAVPSDEEGTK